MKNEIELSDIYFDKRETLTRRELWNKIEELQSQLAEKCNIIEHQHYGIEYWKPVAEKRPDFDYIVKIKDLEQQLAEKEDELNSARVGEQFALKCCNEAKEQLAEKEKELKKIKNLRATPKQLQRAYQERYKYKERCNELKNQHLKDKISFAVEQLEKVNGALTEAIFEVAANEFDTNELCYLEEKFYEKIDQQINELKGEV